jgi:hypothetical protein
MSGRAHRAVNEEGVGVCRPGGAEEAGFYPPVSRCHICLEGLWGRAYRGYPVSTPSVERGGFCGGGVHRLCLYQILLHNTPASLRRTCSVCRKAVARLPDRLPLEADLEQELGLAASDIRRLLGSHGMGDLLLSLAETSGLPQ